VIDNITGFKCEMNNNILFADKIEFLHFERDLLFEMQKNARNIIQENFDIKKQCKKYQDFFKVVAKKSISPKHHLINKKIGSRLDKKWIPNFITKIIRSLIK
jgi:hypothetical protein